MTMTTPRNARRHRYALIYAGATAVAFVSGTLALVAMLVGSPLQFGLPLAVCGAGWIVTHFVEGLAEQDRAHRRRPAPAPRPVRGYARLGARLQPFRRSASIRHTVWLA